MAKIPTHIAPVHGTRKSGFFESGVEPTAGNLCYPMDSEV
jgi:hypothetical protein